MKNLITLFFMIIVTHFVSGQNECYVKLDSAKSYQGECKKGLAHGVGQAIFENFILKAEFKKGELKKDASIMFNDGRFFEFEVEDGQIYGFGKMFAKDSTLLREGYWKGKLTDFNYVGDDKAFLSGYKILVSDNLGSARLSLSKKDVADGESLSNRLIIQLSDNKNRSISNVNFQERTSGEVAQFTETNSRVFIDLSSISFPFVCTLRYMVDNASGNFPLQAILKVEIIEKGQWDMRITY